MQRKFSNRKLSVVVDNIEELKELSRILHDKLYEDTSLIEARLYHGTYNKIFQDFKLSVGLVNNMCELLAQDYFIEHGYELVIFQDFKNSIDLI